MLAAALLFATACGKESSSSGTPTSPTPAATPVATGISIAAPSTGFRTGQNQTFTAQVAFSNGTTQAPSSPAWASSNSTIASVNNAGVVTANTQGTAGISVSSQGFSAQLPIQVWQDYQGTWTGEYVIRVCAQSGDFALGGWCSLFPAGSLLPFRLRLTQNEGAASGTLELGSISLPISGGIFETGRFVGSASGTSTTSGFVFTYKVGTFSVLSNGNALTGNLVVTTTSPALSGNGYWEADLASVTRGAAGISRDMSRFNEFFGRFVAAVR